MKRLLLYGILAVALAAAGVFFGVLWIFRTPDGARWLLAAVSRRTPVRIEAGRLDGTLAEGMRLDGAEVRWPGGAASVGSLRLRWDPLPLLLGRVAIGEMSLETVDVRTAGPAGKKEAAAPAVRWPRVRGLPAALSGEIRTLRVAGLSVNRPDRRPLAVSRLAGRVAWRRGVLEISDFTASTPEAGVSAVLAAGFVRPSLAMTLNLRLAAPVAGYDRLAVAADLEEASRPRIVSGSLRASAAGGRIGDLGFSGTLAVAADRIGLDRFRLSAAGMGGEAGGRAEVVLAEKPFLDLAVAIRNLDLRRETGVRTDLSGSVGFRGTPDRYTGSFSLANRDPGWRAISLAGPFSGSSSGLALPRLAGAWLGGMLRGSLGLSWRGGLVLEGSLDGRGLDPAAIAAEWPGAVNVALNGALEIPGGPGALPQADVKARFLESTLRGHSLTGGIEASYRGGDLSVARLALHGDGFDVTAAGRLATRLAFAADVRALSGLVPEASGRLRAEGWVRRRDGSISGLAVVRGAELSARDIRADGLDLTVRRGDTGGRFVIEAKGRGVAYERLRMDRVGLTAAGTLPAHEARLSLEWPDGEMAASVRGGYRKGGWEGAVEKLSGREAAVGGWALTAPARLAVSPGRIVVSSLTIAAARGGELNLAADVFRSPWRGSLDAAWRKIDLAHANRWLAGTKVSGSTSGTVRGRLSEDETLDLAATAEASGTMIREGLKIPVRQARAEVTWNDRGLRAGWELRLTDGGAFTGRVVSNRPGRLELPQQGDVSMEWSAFDLGLVRSFFPENVGLDGRLSGRADGTFLAGARFRLAGEARIGEGRLRWRSQDATVDAALRTAAVSFSWDGDAVRGDVSLVLEEYGRVQGRFRVPLAARFPPALLPEGPLDVAAEASFREKGLIATFFPGLVQESAGRIGLRFRIGGIWRRPELGGAARIEGASAYLPSAGIRMTDLSARVRFEGDRVLIESFQVRSGPGGIDGSGTVRLKGWRLDGYGARLKGERFQAVNLPEIQALASPDLSVEGTASRLSVRGEIQVPQLSIRGWEAGGPVRPSSDVVVVDAPRPSERETATALDIRVKVTFGDRVTIKVAGIDARLTGSAALAVKGPKDITAQGKIEVAQGAYSAYGIRLNIARGALLFAGGPVDQPALDILALRPIPGGGRREEPFGGEAAIPGRAVPTLPSREIPASGGSPFAGETQVEAGVRVTGTPRTPVVKLYSRPPLPDTTILSYIALGHPLGAGSEQDAGALTQAAGLLLSKGESASFQERLTRQLGLDVLSVQSASDNVAGTMVTVGKYLNPKLYVSFGRSLFTGTNEFRMRYEIGRRWEVQSHTGETSGADLYFRLRFR